MTTDTKLSAPCAAQPSAQAARLGSGRELRSLYDVTGDVKDINTVLLSRDDYRALQPTPVDGELVPVEPHLDPQTPGTGSPVVRSRLPPRPHSSSLEWMQGSSFGQWHCRTRQAKTYP